jgi:hypothetical protein
MEGWRYASIWKRASGIVLIGMQHIHFQTTMYCCMIPSLTHALILHSGGAQTLVLAA